MAQGLVLEGLGIVLGLNPLYFLVDWFIVVHPYSWGSCALIR